MIQESLLQKPILQMTGEEFLTLLKGVAPTGTNTQAKPSPTPSPKKYVYGIRGIANLLNCSISTANRIKKSGVLDGAIIQNGRTIMVDTEKAIQLLKEESQK